jgi:hypothetical protein
LLSGGAFERLNPFIETARDVFRDTVVLEPEMVYPVVDSGGEKKLLLRACLALHRDASHRLNREGFDAVGLIAEIQAAPTLGIGIPSDTKWDIGISQKFSSCDLICLHLDSIIPENFPLVSYFDEERTSL